MKLSSVSAPQYHTEYKGTPITITIWQDHLAYTGGFGSAIVKISGVKNVLHALGGKGHGYVLSKVVTSDFANDPEREAIFATVIEKAAKAIS